MLDAIMNLVTSVISVIVLIWTICNVIHGYEEKYDANKGGITHE
jgi:hypothetical protein